MRILIANDTFFPDLNGSAYFTYRLAFYLKKRGHDVAVIAPSETLHNEKKVRGGINVFGLRSFPIKHYTNFRIAFPFFTQKPITSFIKKFHPDIIHIQGHSIVGRNVAKAARKLGLKVVGTNHFMPENLVFYLHLPHRAEEWLKRKAWNDFRRVYEKLDLVTTPTKTAAGLMEKIGFSKSILPISNGIDLEKFHPGNDGDFLKKRYNLPDKKILLYVGRIDKEKNVDAILRALAKMDRNIVPHFLIAGKGFEVNNLKKLAEKLGIQETISFAGFVPDEDLPFLYRIADVFINAGTAELQSLVTMEAMATGLPVIAVNATALPELVHNGENGYLFEHGDLQGLVNSLNNMFGSDQLRKRFSENSLEIIQAHDIEKVISTFESLYKKLVAR